MTKQEIFDRVKEISLEQFPDNAERIKDMRLGSTVGQGDANGIGLDSMDMIDFVLKIEDAFDVEFDQDELDKVEALGYVGAYVNLLEKHLAAK